MRVLMRVILAAAILGLTWQAFAPEKARANGEAPMHSEDLRTQLAGTWHVVRLRGAVIPETGVPELVFEPARLAGFAGCNRFGAPLTYGEGGSLAIGAPASERKACGDAAMKVEAQVLRAVMRINSVTFEGADRIILRAFGTEMMVAERKE